MSRPEKPIYEFGPFRFDSAEHLLLLNGEPVPLTPKLFDTLMALVESSGHLVEKDELMQRLWPDSFVEETTLTHNISDLRKALGENANDQKYIETVPKRGYRFVANVRQIGADSLELIVEKRTHSRLVVEEERISEPKAPPVRRWAAPAVMLGVLLAVVAGLVVYQRTVDKTPAPTVAQVKSLAILPFKPLGADTGDEYLGLGMTDTLITKLSGVERIIVRPTSAVQKYAGNQDPVTAGREQRVDAVLEGSIQRAGERVRVTVRLLNVGDGASLWAYKCDEYCADIFATQDSISQQVATALMSKLTGEEKVRLSKRGTESGEAYQAYLKGRYFWNKRNEETLRKAVGFFEQAIAGDPAYAQAYAGLSDTYTLLGGYAFMPQREAIPKARSAAEKAIELDPALAEAHNALATIYWNNDWNFAEAEKEFRLALELNPNYATAHHYYGEFMVLLGRFDEGLAKIRHALELDPLSLIINTDLGADLYHARRYDEAIEQLRKTLEMDPRFMRAHNWLIQVYTQKGMFEEAIADIQGQSPTDPTFLTLLTNTYAAAGKRKEALKELDKLRQLARRRYLGPEPFIGFYLLFGEKDKAFELLEKAYEGRSTAMTSLKVNPGYDPIRSDPRFADLLRRIGFPE